jgi:UDP-N-acetyl-D-mannosaminuronate dehydrogenase
VAYLLLTLILVGLGYAGWRLTRLTAARQTRVIGPDDDPDFLRRLGPGDQKPRP